MILPRELQLPAALLVGGGALIVLAVALDVPQLGLVGVVGGVVGVVLLIRAAFRSLGDRHE